jgi:TolA-binding protein
MREPGVPQAQDAAFFYAASFFRQSDWTRASREFKRLLARDPHGRWAAAAHWHIAICDLRRGRVRRARARFAWVIRRFPEDRATVEGARVELRRITGARRGLLVELWRRLTGRADA